MFENRGVGKLFTQQVGRCMASNKVTFFTTTAIGLRGDIQTTESTIDQRSSKCY